MSLGEEDLLFFAGGLAVEEGEGFEEEVVDESVDEEGKKGREFDDESARNCW